MHLQNIYYTPDLTENIDILRPLNKMLRQKTQIEQCDWEQYNTLHSRVVERIQRLTTDLLRNGLIECIADGRIVKASHFAACWQAHMRQPSLFTNTPPRSNDQPFDQVDEDDQSAERSKISSEAESVPNSPKVSQVSSWFQVICFLNN